VIYNTQYVLGKSLICKEKAIQTAEKEEHAENEGIKNKADPVFFLSLVEHQIFLS
jgi:hypothetical protein